MQATIEFSAEFEREVSLHQGLLLGAAMRFTRSRPEAEDLVQETVFRAWRFWGTFETGTHRRAWLLRILRNTFINRHRRTRREREVLAEVRQAPWSAEGWCSEPSESLREGAMGDQVTAALEALPDAFRRVLVLVDLDDLSYREAADVLGCPVGTVMSRLHRARRAMQTSLEGYATEEGYRRDRRAA